MADATAEEEVKKPSKLPLILGLVLAIAGGGGGFYAVYSGMILGGDSEHAADDHGAADDAHGDGHDDAHGDDHGGDMIEAIPLGDRVFVPLDPLMISLAPGGGSRHLRFRAQLEVPSEHERAVRAVLPRVIDVLNSYLRAVETRDFENPAILGKLRAQMLRRVQIVAGADHVRDLLIMEFVLN